MLNFVQYYTVISVDGHCCQIRRQFRSCEISVRNINFCIFVIVAFINQFFSLIVLLSYPL